MSDLHTHASRTEVFDFGPIQRGATPIDLTVASTRMWFTVKRSPTDDDGAAVCIKTWVAGGVSNGIAVIGAGNKNTGTITVPSSDTDSFEASDLAYWDLVLQEPDGRVTTIDEGIYRITLPVGRPV